MFKAGYAKLLSLKYHLLSRVTKSIIGLQERLGLYPYDRWLKKEQKESGNPKCSSFFRTGDQPKFAVLLVPRQEAELELLYGAILSCLQRSDNSYWTFVVIADGSSSAKQWTTVQSNERIRFVDYVELPRWLDETVRSDQKCWMLQPCLGDRLEPSFFDEIARVINQNPDADLCYFDEDYPLPSGRRQPFLKPDWSPETMLSVNLLSRPLVSSKLISHLIAQGQSMDFSSEEWVYRVAAQAKCIIHIPSVLYHRNTIHPSYLEPNDDSTQVENARIFLAEQGLPKPVAWREDGHVRVSWAFEDRPFVSIIVPTRDHPELIRRLIASLLEKTSYQPFEILLMDNNSSDLLVLDYYRLISGDDRIRIFYQKEPFNYSRYNNMGANHARGDVLVFLNNDIEIISPDWLVELVRWVLVPGIGAVGAQLLYPDGTVQHAGIVVGLQGHAGHVFLGDSPGAKSIFGSPGWYRNVSAVTGACLAIRKDVFESVNGFDEKFILAFNDVEIGIRLVEAGFRNLYNPYARLIHYEGRSRGKHIPANDIQVGYDQLKDWVARGDPYFNPNLSHLMNTPTLRRSFEEIPADRLEWIRACAAKKGNTNG